LETLHVIYQALIQPHFDYCNIVWGNCGKTLSNKLQLKLQNRAMRVLTFSNFVANASSLLEKLGWDDLNQQRQFQKALIVFKSLNNFAPEYLCSKFINRNNVTPYILRDSVNKLAAPLPRTNNLKNSFSYSGACSVMEQLT
jgi:hypothetical protein